MLTHENINSVQVVGVPDNLNGEAIAVFILNGDKKLTLEEVRKFLISNNVADFKLPDIVKYIDVWPLTALGKIDRNKLKENLQKTFEPLKHKTIKEANAIIKKGFKNKLPLTSEWKVTIHNDSSR